MPCANWNVIALYPQTAQNEQAVRAFNATIAGFAASHRLGGIVKPCDVPADDVSRLEE
ncbi:MAG TPA: hypothetical protein VMH92_10735 [Acidocella sp.]|nr:hypothetical protein [Acidocella sp.]